MEPIERVERARLNMHLCFDTEVGKRYVDTRFTALALLVGAPDSHNWHQFGDAFGKVFDLEPGSCTMTYIDEWRAHYKRWYQREGG